MDPTIEFLWERRRRGDWTCCTSHNWAIALLESGVESDAIRRMAAEPDLHWQIEEALIAQALRDLGQFHLENPLTLMRAFEQASVADYLTEKIDGWTLIDRGYDLYYSVGRDHNEFEPWIGLANEANQYGQGIGGPNGFDRLPFDVALKSVLRQWERFPVPPENAHETPPTFPS